MNREEFMNRLRNLLSDITEAEREEALTYYEDYFDDAGAENEASVINSLGSPEKVAATIKEGLSDSSGENGEFSETGYSSHYQNKDEVAAKTLSSEERGFGKKKSLSGGMILLIVILCIFALPILGPIAIGIVALFVGILCAVAAVLAAVMICGVSIVIAGFALFVTAVIAFFAFPAAGFLLLGSGLILVGLGILITMLGIWIFAKLLPPLVRGFVKLCRMPFERKGAEK